DDDELADLGDQLVPEDLGLLQRFGPQVAGDVQLAAVVGSPVAEELWFIELDIEADPADTQVPSRQHGCPPMWSQAPRRDGRYDQGGKPRKERWRGSPRGADGVHPEEGESSVAFGVDDPDRRVVGNRLGVQGADDPVAADADPPVQRPGPGAPLPPLEPPLRHSPLERLELPGDSPARCEADSVRVGGTAG